jgi:predicted dehydrogenase
MSAFRVAVIGAGFGQQVHIPVFRSFLDCKVVAICASDKIKAQSVAEKLSIPQSFGDWSEMIENVKPDIISVAVRPAVHYEILLCAMKKRIAVFCEKPLCLKYSDAEELRALSAKNNAIAMIDFEFPENQVWQNCHARLRNGEIGRLESIHVEWLVQTYANRCKLDSWKTRTAEGGGALYAFSSHALNYLEWFAGDIRELSAKLSRKAGDDRATDTLNEFEIKFRVGATAKVTVNTDYALAPQHRINLKGSAGEMTLINKTADHILGFEFWSKQGLIETSQAVVPPLGTYGRFLAAKPLVDRLIHWLKNGVPSKPDIESGVRVQRLIHPALQSQGNFVPT